MIDAIHGVLIDIDATRAIIGTDSFDFSCIISNTTSSHLLSLSAEERASVTLYTFLHHKDDLMELYGFQTKEERSMFFELIKVQGIGPKQAMKILSGISVQALVEALDSGDIGTLTRIPGLGTKTAQKMVLSLRNRLELFTTDTAKADARNSTLPLACKEILHALTEMGYDRKSAKDAVLESYQLLHTEGIDEKRLEEELFKASIIKLA